MKTDLDEKTKSMAAGQAKAAAAAKAAEEASRLRKEKEEAEAKKLQASKREAEEKERQARAAATSQKKPEAAPAKKEVAKKVESEADDSYDDDFGDFDRSGDLDASASPPKAEPSKQERNLSPETSKDVQSATTSTKQYLAHQLAEREKNKGSNSLFAHS